MFLVYDSVKPIVVPIRVSKKMAIQPGKRLVSVSTSLTVDAIQIPRNLSHDESQGSSWININ